MDHRSDIAIKTTALRRFNRFYFCRMRFLREAMSGPGYRAPELRVFRELGESVWGTMAARLAYDLRMDPGRLSRILGVFRAQGYLDEQPAPDDKRISIIRLSPHGRRRYEAQVRAAEEAVSLMLRLMTPQDRQRLLDAMAVVEEILRRIR